MQCVILDWILEQKKDIKNWWNSNEVWSLEFNTKGNLNWGEVCIGNAFIISTTFP